MTPEIFLFLGPEEFLLRESLEMFKKAALEKYGDFSVSTISFLSIPLGELKSEVFSPPFFGGKRVIFITDFPPAASPQLSEEKRTAYLEFAESLKNIPEGVVLIFSSVSPDRRAKIFKAVQDCAKEIKVFESFDEKKEPYRFSEWIIERAKRYGGRIDRPTAEFLKNYSGHQLETLDKEIQKLSLCCIGRDITIKDIEELSIPASEVANFALSNAVASGMFSVILSTILQLTENFEAGTIWNRDILPVFRSILKIKGISLKETDAKGAGINPFVLSKMEKVSAPFSLSQLKDIHSSLLEIEQMTKDGRLSLTGDTRLFYLVLEKLLHEVFGHKEVKRA